MKISGVSDQNKDRYMYNPLIKNNYNTQSQNDFSTSSTENSEQTDGSFSDILSSLFSNNNKIKSYVEYTPKSFGGETSQIYNDFMTKGLSVAKVYTTAQYQKLLKDAEEFEKLIRKLVAEAQKNNQGAIDALKIINTMLKESEGSSKPPQELLSNLMSNIRNYIKSFDTKDATATQIAMLDVLTFSLNAIKTENDAVSKISENASIYQKFDDEKSENAYLSAMFAKAKQKKRYDPAESTKEYVKKKEKEDLISSKLEEINTLRYSDKPSAKDEIDKIVNEISTMGFERGKLFILDPVKMTRSIQSPMFA